jgi:hypothetical protein
MRGYAPLEPSGPAHPMKNPASLFRSPGSLRREARDAYLGNVVTVTTYLISPRILKSSALGFYRRVR